MSKAFPVAKDVFLASAETEYQFRLKPLPASNFAKAKKVAGTLNGVAVTFPTTNSKGWTPDDSILYYLWVTLPDGRTGWITSDYGVPFVDGFALETKEGETKRADPVRKLKDGPDSPEARRLAGFKSAWEAKKKAAEAVAAETEPEAPAAEGEPAGEPVAEEPKKKGKKK
jgi:hypothetical protein